MFHIKGSHHRDSWEIYICNAVFDNFYARFMQFLPKERRQSIFPLEPKFSFHENPLDHSASIIIYIKYYKKNFFFKSPQQKPGFAFGGGGAQNELLRKL